MLFSKIDDERKLFGEIHLYAFCSNFKILLDSVIYLQIANLQFTCFHWSSFSQSPMSGVGEVYKRTGKFLANELFIHEWKTIGYLLSENKNPNDEYFNTLRQQL